jgi:hypothetical protein
MATSKRKQPFTETTLLEALKNAKLGVVTFAYSVLLGLLAHSPAIAQPCATPCPAWCACVAGACQESAKQINAVRFRMDDGRYLQAIAGGGAGLAAATVGNPSTAETFLIVAPTTFPLSNGAQVVFEVVDTNWSSSGLRVRTEATPVSRGGNLVRYDFGGPGTGLWVKECCVSRTGYGGDVREWTFMINNSPRSGGTISTGDRVFLNTLDGYFFRVTGSASGALVSADVTRWEDGSQFTVEFLEVRARLGPRPATVQCATCGTVTGTVADAATGQLIAGATVSATGTNFTGTTDNKGQFTLSGCVPAGALTLNAAADGYHSEATPVTVTAGSGTSASIRLQRCATIVVTVTDATTGQPIANPTVKIGNNSPVTTDASGHLEILECQEGALNVKTTAVGYEPGTDTVTVPRTGSVRLDIRLQPQQAGTIPISCDTTWQVVDTMFNDLGSAQEVCLNQNSPTNCRAGATRYGYSGAGWRVNLSSIAGATWIWAPAVTGATAPAFPAEFNFSHSYNVPRPPIAGTISVAADDFAEVFVNNRMVGKIGSETNAASASSASSSLTTFDIAPHLTPGLNRIRIRAANGNFSCGAGPYRCNPAGLVCGGEIRY